MNGRPWRRRLVLNLDDNGNAPAEAEALRQQIAACAELARRVNALNKRIAKERGQ